MNTTNDVQAAANEASKQRGKVSKDGKEIIVGVVTEALPNANFRIKIEAVEDPILGYLSGRMTMNRIRVQVGDKVEFELNPSGTSRITRRL